MTQKYRRWTDRGLGNHGITMIELVIGMAVMAVVSLMAGALLSTSARMYRATTASVDIQAESQLISRRISAAIMNASHLYVDDSSAGVFLFTGVATEEADGVRYEGELIWFNKTTNCLYQNSSVSIRVSGENPLSADKVEEALEGGSDPREYLISDKVQALRFLPVPALKEENRVSSASDFYVTDGEMSVKYEIVLKNLESKEYMVEASTTPRNHLDDLRWRTD